MPEAPMLTRFFELEGSVAREALGRLGATLLAEGARVRLLASTDRPGLYLLVAESRHWPAAPPPQGCRVWTFQRASA
ncbi:MAG: hypothetical protein P8Z81_05320 [Deinococcales bacterium]